MAQRLGEALLKVLRGEIHWVDLSPVQGSEQGGLRPVLVLQHDILNVRSSTTIGLAITSRPQRQGYPLTIKLESGEGGLPQPSWIKVTQIRTLALTRFRGKVGALSKAYLSQVESALVEVLGIDLDDPPR
jgi:mRNA interferase MazF